MPVEQRKQKRFRVNGLDENGDVHAFESDSEERARSVEQQVLEDLDDVNFEDLRT